MSHVKSVTRCTQAAHRAHARAPGQPLANQTPDWNGANVNWGAAEAVDQVVDVDSIKD